MKLVFVLLFLLSFQWASSQVGIGNDPLLRELMQLKEQMTRDYKLKEFYVIQVHSGGKDKAQEIKNAMDGFLREQKVKDSFEKEVVITYETPNYKVWIGRFGTRLLADRFFLKIKDEYPNALILKPGLG